MELRAGQLADLFFFFLFSFFLFADLLPEYWQAGLRNLYVGKIENFGLQCKTG